MPKNITNNFLVSVNELALFCAMASYRAYSEINKLSASALAEHKKREAFLKRAQWCMLPTSEEVKIGHEEGYFAVAYYKINHELAEAEVVIAHRGTCLNKGNIISDMIIMEGWKGNDTLEFPPRIITKAAAGYLNKIFGHEFFYNFIKTNDLLLSHEGKRYPIRRIIHTGFSLGGFIAGFCAGCSQSDEVYALTIDAPGLSDVELMFAGEDNNNKIVNYVTTPNLVNTCKKHVGEIRQITHFINNDAVNDNKDVKIIFDLNKISDLQYLIFGVPELIDTLESHNINSIIKSNLLDYRVVAQWPTADNQLIYGQCPNGDEIAALLSAIMWNVIKQFCGHGITGIEHKRNNIIKYVHDKASVSLLEVSTETAHAKTKELASEQQQLSQNSADKELQESRLENNGLQKKRKARQASDNILLSTQSGIFVPLAGRKKPAMPNDREVRKSVPVISSDTVVVDQVTQPRI